MHAQPASEQVRDQVLGRRLSGAAGDGDDRQRLTAQAVRRDVEERLPGIHDLDHGCLLDTRWRPLAEDSGGAPLNRLRDEDVPVMELAAQRHEKAARRDLSGIGEELIQ